MYKIFTSQQSCCQVNRFGDVIIQRLITVKILIKASKLCYPQDEKLDENAVSFNYMILSVRILVHTAAKPKIFK